MELTNKPRHYTTPRRNSIDAVFNNKRLKTLQFIVFIAVIFPFILQMIQNNCNNKCNKFKNVSLYAKMKSL